MGRNGGDEARAFGTPLNHRERPHLTVAACEDNVRWVLAQDARKGTRGD